MPQTNASPLEQLDKNLEDLFLRKIPYQLPPDAKELIVKFAPWIVIIFTLLALPVIFSALALTSLFSPLAYAAGASMYWVIPTVILVVSVIMNLLALPGLFNRTMPGWKYTFYGEVLSVLSTLLSGNIVGAIVGGAIGFYILYQVKSYYK